MPKNIEEVKEVETAAGNLNDDELLDVMYNEIFEDLKWYLGELDEKIGAGNEEYSDEQLDMSYKTLIEDIKLFLAELKKRNEGLDDYPKLKELLKIMLGA
jgi:hypothetical protein